MKRLTDDPVLNAMWEEWVEFARRPFDYGKALKEHEMEERLVPRINTFTGGAHTEPSGVFVAREAVQEQLDTLHRMVMELRMQMREVQDRAQSQSEKVFTGWFYTGTGHICYADGSGTRTVCHVEDVNQREKLVSFLKMVEAKPCTA